MMFYILILAVVAMALFILNVYQFLTQRAALRIADILYIMSRNVREKAAEVRRDRKDVEIVEAHLFDISTSARSLLRALGRRESTLGPDPSVDLIPGGSRPSADSLLRLADNILYGVMEEFPDAEWKQIQDRALERFHEKTPGLDQKAARKIISAVGRRGEHETNSSPTFVLSDA